MPQQLLIDVHEPLPMEAGQPEQEDYEFELLMGKRYIKVDRAHAIRYLADERYPEAEMIVVVMDKASFTRHLSPLKPDGWAIALSFTTLPSTGVG